MIARTFFAELAKRTPFVMFQNRLYQIDGSSIDENFLKIGNQQFGLIPSSSLAELEILYRDLNAEEIFDYKRNFIDNYVSQEIKSQDEMRKYVKRNKILHFMFYELFPLFNDQDDEIEALLKGEEVEEEGKKDIDDIIEEEFGAYEVTTQDIKALKKELLKGLEYREECVIKDEKKELYQEEEDQDLELMLKDHYQQQGLSFGKSQRKFPSVQEFSGLGKIINGKPIFVFQDKVYLLEPTNREDPSEVVVLSRVPCILKPITDVRTVENAFYQYFEFQFKKEAVEEFSEQMAEIQKIRIRNKSLETLAERTEYEKGDVGYLRDGNIFYFYIKIPKFAMKHPRKDEYYAFNSCKVGIKLRYSDEGYVYSEDVVVIDSYSHPFLKHDEGYAFQRICLGNYNLNNSRSAEQIKKHLSTGVNVIMNGYSRTCGPYHSIECFENKKISLSDAKKRGFLITNIHRSGGTENEG